MYKTHIAILAILFFTAVNGDNKSAIQTVDSNLTKETGICRLCICKNQTIDCHDQKISNLFKKEEWAELKDLKPTKLDFCHNPIKVVTQFPALPIEILNFSRCNIESIQTASFENLTSLRVLDLSYNNLTSAKLSRHAFEGHYSPEALEPLPSLRVLNLSYNDLHSLPMDLFEHIEQLTDLDLSGNPLTTIDTVTVVAISALTRLETLKLRHCQLKIIPDKFLHTPRLLKNLDLSNNLLEAIPQELRETKSLVYLNLNQNPISELNSDSEKNPGFPSLPKLEELHMSNMKSLTRIGMGALSGLESLIRLHLSHNPKLAFIDPKALARPDEKGENLDWPPLKEIYLQSNNLSEIDSRLIARWDLMQVIDLSNNPFLCDCSTQWMVDILVTYIEEKRVNASQELVCRQPVEMRGYTMKHLHDIHRKMRCVDKYGRRPEKDTAILLGVLIGVLLSVPIMIALTILWKRGFFAFVGFRSSVDGSRAFYKRAQINDNML